MSGDLKESDILEKMGEELSKEGIGSRWVPISRWKEIRDEIDQTLDGLTDLGILKHITQYYDFGIEKSLDDPRSILVLGIPDPKIRFRFNRRGQEVEGVVPPGYLNFSDVKNRIESILQNWLGENGFKFASLKIPKKLMAVRSGLARYGRNNISYVEGMGSHLILMTYASDLPVEDREWHEKRAMKACDKCDLCLRNCPTGAIDGSRFLIRAERCLTYFNEEEPDIPEWVESSWHNCLVGCMRCQDICPANRRVKGNIIEGPTFSDEETEVLLRVTKMEDLPKALRAKVEESDLSALYPVLPRNLRLLLDAP